MSKRNIFLAMGLDPEEAMILAVRADLADAIAAHFKNVERSEIQKKLGLSQSVVSQLVNGKIDHLSVERLMKAMVRADIPGFAQWATADAACGGRLEFVPEQGTIRQDFHIEGGEHIIQSRDNVFEEPAVNG